VLYAVTKTTEKHIKPSMIDVDVGDQRTTISLSRASHNLLNPSEAKVVWWTQAKYVNDSHNANDNANANANANANDNDNDNVNVNANANANANDNVNANANDNAMLCYANANDNANVNGFLGHSRVSCFFLISPRP
jgi:hypothetical protein